MIVSHIILSNKQRSTVYLKCLYNSTIQYINNSKILLKFIMALSQIGISQTSKPQKKYESLKSWEFFLSLIFRTYKTMYLGKKRLKFRFGFYI